MPKTKKEALPPIIEDEEEKVIDPEIIVGDAISDDEEVDPFKDRFEE
jgi:hypothetical protein